MSDTKPGVRYPALPPLAAAYWLILTEVANQHGYALAIHGSMSRDIDLVAVPWTDEATDAETLVAAFGEAVGYGEGWSGTISDSATSKPHGRRAWTLGIGHGAWIDLSVMPREGGAA